MKTNYIKIITLAITVITLAACSNYLEVKPQGQVVLGDYWKASRTLML